MTHDSYNQSDDAPSSSSSISKADEETPPAQAERLLVQIKEPHLEPHDGNWDSDCTPCKAQLELECCAVTIVEAYRSALAASQARLHRLEQAICPSGQLNGDAIVGLAKCHRQDSELLDGLDAEDGVTMIRETIGALRWRAEQADQQRRSAEARIALRTEDFEKALARIEVLEDQVAAAEAGRAPLRALVDDIIALGKKCGSGEVLVMDRLRLTELLEAVLQGSLPPREETRDERTARA